LKKNTNAVDEHFDFELVAGKALRLSNSTSAVVEFGWKLYELYLCAEWKSLPFISV